MGLVTAHGVKHYDLCILLNGNYTLIFKNANDVAFKSLGWQHGLLRSCHVLHCSVMILKYTFKGVEEKHKHQQDVKSLFKMMIKHKYFNCNRCFGNFRFKKTWEISNFWFGHIERVLLLSPVN